MDQKLSVFHLFSELFPEYANDKDRDGGTTGGCLCTEQRMPAGSVGPFLARVSPEDCDGGCGGRPDAHELTWSGGFCRQEWADAVAVQQDRVRDV